MAKPAREAAAALARVLARESTWLARAGGDAAAAERAARGLAWLAGLARTFEARRAAEYFAALGAREPAAGAPASAAWGTLGAPLCERLAGEVKRARSFAALADDALDWDPHVDGVRAFEEPAPAAGVAEPAAEPAAAEPPEPEPPAIYLAVAAFAGEREPRLSVSSAWVDIAGEHAPGAVTPDALAALEAAARADGAVLTLREDDAGGLAWRVRVRPAGSGEYLFREDAQGRLAIPAHRAVAPEGPADDPAAEGLVFGHGLRRAGLDPAALAAGALPAGLGLAGETAAADGVMARIVEVVDDAATAAWLAPPPVEPLQAPPAPADNPDDAVRPPAAAPGAFAPRRALVADDSVMARVFLGRLLAQEGLVVEMAEDGIEARALLAAGGFDLVFLDVDMPGGGALEIARGLDPDARARVCALVKDDAERSRVEAEGLALALLKPFAEDEVRALLGALRGGGEPNP